MHSIPALTVFNNHCLSPRTLMLWDPLAQSNNLSAQSNAGSWFYRYADSEYPSSHPPSQANGNINDTYRHPNDLPFLGQLPQLSDQAVHGFSDWNSSMAGLYPSQLLQGPGQAGPSSLSQGPCLPLPSIPRKCKRTTSPDPAAVGGYGPIPGSPDERTDQESTPDPGPAIKFTERKNSAYDIWAFAWAVKTDENIPTEQWLDDYGNHLTRRPDTMFIGCKFCTQFG